MTVKRFIMIYFETDGNLIFDETKHNGEWYNSAECLQDNEIVELLNELYEENQLLLKASEKDSELIKTLRKGIHRWRKENEWLKERIKELK